MSMSSCAHGASVTRSPGEQMSLSAPVRTSRLGSFGEQIPGLLLIGALVGVAFAINSVAASVSPLAVSVALGFLVANLFSWPGWAAPGGALASKRLMRTGVALLGMQLSFRALAEIGVAGVLTVLAVVVCTILGVIGLSRLFGMSGELGLLIGVGFGICGATAVAAVRGQTRATQQEVSYAIGLIALCGTLSIIVLPFVASLLGLADGTFGAWAGAAVHDVGQVVATASMRGDEAVQSAVVVKLARVTMLAPVVILLSIRHRRFLAAQGETHDGVTVPWVPAFVVAFLIFAALNSTGFVSSEITGYAVTVSKVLLAAGLVALGSAVRWKDIRSIGGRPLAMGLVAWVLVAGVALAAVTLTGL
jgi:uncharacterized integral membrane protein (TIGR00698 family)